MLPIVEGLLKGDRRSLARAISIVDNDEPESRQIVREIFGNIGKAKTVGFTGPGGAGKSSLVGSLIPHCQGWVQGRSPSCGSDEPSDGRGDFGRQSPDAG